MRSPTDPADRTGTIGVEAFDAAYGAGFQASDDSPHAVECELVEDGGAFVAHRPTGADRPRRVAFVDGTLRTEARLTSTGPEGDVSMGLAGSWAAGAVLVDGNEPALFSVNYFCRLASTIFAGSGRRESRSTTMTPVGRVGVACDVQSGVENALPRRCTVAPRARFPCRWRGP